MLTRKQLQRNLSNNIKFYRKKYELTQVQLSKLSKINRPTISMIENKKMMPTIYIAYKISRAFSISLEDLVED